MEEILAKLSKKLEIANENRSCIAKYSQLKTDEERVKFTTRLLHDHNMPPVVKFEEKNIDKSLRYRDEGNKMFTSRQSSLNETIELYTKSVVFSPTGSKELSLAYANRSAALFKARLYTECLKDISRALKLSYPDELKAKLFARRARCLLILKKKSDIDVKKALEEAEKWLEKMDLNNSGRGIVEKILNNPEKMAAVEREFIKWDEEKNCPLVPSDNLEIKDASSAIELRYCEEFGKHIVATRDIKPGEVLAVQRNYASVLVPEKFYSNCSWCLKQCWSGIACDGCVDVVYCDEECRSAAWREHHEIECGVIGPLVGVEMSNLGLLSLRLAVRALKEAGSFEELKKIIREAETAEDPRTDGFTAGRLDDTKYKSVYTLARNTEKRSVADLFGRSLNAVYIVYMLATRSNMFGEKFHGDLECLEKHEWAMFVGGLIMRHQQIIPSNAHSLSEENLSPDPNERAAALMPFYSLFNHTCDPPVTRVSFGQNMVLYAIYPIKKGQQIFDNYGMHYALHPKNYRQSSLKQQYRFICECTPCVENWPTFLDIPSYETQRFLSTNDKKKLNQAVRNFPQYYEQAMKAKVDENPKMIEGLLTMINIFFKQVSLPCREINEMIETLKRIYHLLANRYQLLD